jgi:hypothetical protein
VNWQYFKTRIAIRQSITAIMEKIIDGLFFESWSDPNNKAIKKIDPRIPPKMNINGILSLPAPKNTSLIGP